MGFINRVKKFFTVKKIIVLAVILTALGGFYFYSQKKAVSDIDSTQVKKGEINEELILTGQVKAVEHANLNFPTSGELNWVGVKVGDQVKKGQALASLDKTTLNAAYQQALNNVRMYEASVDSVHDSLKDKDETETFAEKSTRTTAEVAKDNAYDALKAAEYNFRNATLKAPFTGFVTRVAHPYPGINISLTESQVELLNPKTIYFEVTADQSEVTDLSIGQKVIVVLDSFSDKEIEGEISFISQTPKPGEAGAVYEVRVKFKEDGELTEKLKIGMTGDAKFILQTKEDALYVPSDFVNRDSKGKYVFLGSIKNKVYVETGIEGENDIEITNGVKEEDTLFDK